MTTIRDENFVFSIFESVTWNEIYCSTSRLNKFTHRVSILNWSLLLSNFELVFQKWKKVVLRVSNLILYEE